METTESTKEDITMKQESATEEEETEPTRQPARSSTAESRPEEVSIKETYKVLCKWL